MAALERRLLFLEFPLLTQVAAVAQLITPLVVVADLAVVEVEPDFPGLRQEWLALPIPVAVGVAQELTRSPVLPAVPASSFFATQSLFRP